MKTKQQVSVCVQMDLRDFGAFEDLMGELGYHFKCEIINTPQKKNGVTHKKKRVRITDEIISGVKKMHKEQPHLSYGDLGMGFGISETSVWRILNQY